MSPGESEGHSPDSVRHPTRDGTSTTDSLPYGVEDKMRFSLVRKKQAQIDEDTGTRHTGLIVGR